ncbi:MAG: T9SS type A sorting domain-containing protein [Bacteroidota bacterium]
MKTLVFCIAFLFISSQVYSQNCARVITTFITNPSNDHLNYTIDINWNSDGQKHIFVKIYCGNLLPANLITTKCIDISCAANCSGSTSYNFVCAGSTPTAVFIAYTGNCNGGTQCAPPQQYPPGGGTPLPIKISSFEVRRNSNNVTLNWQTETEVNAKEFIIERSTENYFIPIGAVPATNISSGSTYSFIDNNIPATEIQYRLKMVDIDGSYAYSTTRSIKGISQIENFIVFPNPTANSAKIVLSGNPGPSEIQLIDNQGRLQKKIQMLSGNSIVLNDLKKGVYLIRVIMRNTGLVTFKKIMVTN